MCAVNSVDEEKQGLVSQISFSLRKFKASWHHLSLKHVFVKLIKILYDGEKYFEGGLKRMMGSASIKYSSQEHSVSHNFNLLKWNSTIFS